MNNNQYKLNYIKTWDFYYSKIVYRIWGSDERPLNGWNYSEEDFNLIEQFCVKECILLINRQG